MLRKEWNVGFRPEDDDGTNTFRLGQHPCWNHSDMQRWCSDECASPLEDRLLDDQTKCDCGGITAADVMSKEGWQYDHGYCEPMVCLRGDKLWMCWRARLTVMLDEGDEDDDGDDEEDEDEEEEVSE